MEESILDANTILGNDIRKQLDAKQILSLNIMASPGAGKTSIIMQTVERLKKMYRLAVIEGDIVPIDVKKIQKLGIPVVLAHTGGSCHLESVMMEHALKKLDLNALDILIVENVGNLICPASFYLGTHRNVVIASVPEGDDKPYKYPAMFRGADIVLLNKSDYLHTESFHVKHFTAGVKLLNKEGIVLKVSCRTGEGIDSWIEWVKNSRALLRQGNNSLSPGY